MHEWRPTYFTVVLRGMFEKLSDGRWSSPGDLTEILTETLYFRLLLDEGFDFHGSATLGAL